MNIMIVVFPIALGMAVFLSSRYGYRQGVEVGFLKAMSELREGEISPEAAQRLRRTFAKISGRGTQAPYVVLARNESEDA